MSSKPYRMLFVCMGNICRSPTAEAVMRRLVSEAGRSGLFDIDSAGTGSWHVGQPPDARARAAAEARGYQLTGRARAVREADFFHFDMLASVDDDNLARLKEIAPPNTTAIIRKLSDADVPDPYYEGAAGFETVLDQIEAACRELLREVLEPEWHS